MSQDIYTRLAEHLDRLPNGYPATESGVELRILKKLFNPQEAELACSLTLRPEPATAIAARMDASPAETEELLQAMAAKGLAFSLVRPERPTLYMAAQYVIGIWEYHVNSLDAELVADMNQYAPILFREAFDSLPQLRTIPVNRSVAADQHIMAHEEAEAMVRQQKHILVAPCICRKEHAMAGDGCDRPLETCLIFGWAADYYQRNGLGRVIGADEAVGIIKSAEEAGLVLQPNNQQSLVNICCCCGCCCQVLKNLKRHPAPARAAVSAFVAQLDQEACTGCGICLDRCQMEAFTLAGEAAELNPDRCIGCGLCVSTCPGEALSLVRKPEENQPHVPLDRNEELSLRVRARARMASKLERGLEA